MHSVDTKRVRAQRDDGGAAFLPDPYDVNSRAPARAHDDLAESLAEQFVSSVTSAEAVSEDTRDELVAEEFGGPFVETEAGEEFAGGTDLANPSDAVREAFPTATGTGSPKR